ncbi:MAG: phosphoribosylanthranilate isomerase [Lachnospiraceae bacterium]|nr:phosphoribosylanthranilate isomerase [Lachnospiraceae bacterium]
MKTESVKVKICGLSRPEDIESVNEARPDYCGFIINVPGSIRNTTPEQMRALRKNLSPEIIPVGVFRNAPIETVAELLKDGTISAAQLHGNEDENYIRKLRLCGDFTIIKAFRAPKGTEEDTASESSQIIRWAEQVNHSSANLVLLDHGSGGTGETFEWKLAERIQRPFLLAGGIGPDNIEEALNQLQPWGVDMSSSVETDGKKDREKILAAVAKVRQWKPQERKVSAL